MKFSLSLFIIFITFNIYGYEIKDIIHDPAISRRCKALLSERTDKIKVQQKLNSLLLRNKKLQQKSKINQKTVKTRLELNYIQVKNNLRLTQMRLKSMEENIVRKGCPGITL
jgi:hypothetical protein